MTINPRYVLYTFLLFFVSCSRLYYGSWNQPYFDENVQPDELGKNVVQRSIGRTELYLAEEVFYCGTAMEIIPIISIDNKKIGLGSPGNITKKIQQIYDNIVFGREEKYMNWLTPVKFS